MVFKFYILKLKMFISIFGNTMITIKKKKKGE